MATLGFRIRHYLWTLPPSQTVHNTCSPIFSSLLECQADARRQFDLFLTYYLHHGQSGVYHDELDLVRRGLITAYVFRRDFYGRVRKELCPLSEFVIKAVRLSDESEAPQIRHEQAKASSSGAHGRFEPLGADPLSTYALNMQPGPDYELER